MTKRLFLSDPYTISFEGRIVKRLETSLGPAVVLEETYFYPESGGQPHDLGTIEGIRVTQVIEQGEDLHHVLTRYPEADRVSCRIDQERRRDYMQQHNGQHILSAAFVQEAGSQTLAFHLGRSTSTIDLDRASLAPALIDAAEREANRVVRSATAVRSYFVKPEEAAQLKLRKPVEVEGILRIVEIEGFDLQACCGTHPQNTAEVGVILIRGVERVKKGTRVEFVCGERAMRDYRSSIDRIRSLARTLSSPEEGLVDVAARLIEERKDLAKSLQASREEALEHRVAAWMADAETLHDFKMIVREVSDVTPGELRLLAILATKEPSRVALLGTRAEGRAHLVFGRSADGLAADMAALLREVLPSVEGKGGGSSQIAQGGGPRLEGLNQALELARLSLEGNQA